MKHRILIALFALLASAGAASAYDEYLGEVRAFPYEYCPENWAPAWGQIMPINTNTALFALLGNRYGGDGRANFALPDLRSAELVSKDAEGDTKVPVAHLRWCIALKGNWPPRH
jgi:microcystin-dependent protein